VLLHKVFPPYLSDSSETNYSTFRSSKRLSAALHPITRSLVVDLVRGINSYYSTCPRRTGCWIYWRVDPGGRFWCRHGPEQVRLTGGGSRVGDSIAK